MTNTNNQVVYFTFSENASDQWRFTKLVWKDDVEFLTNQAVDLGLVVATQETEVYHNPPPLVDMVWSRVEIVDQMTEYKLHKLKVNGENDYE